MIQFTDRWIWSCRLGKMLDMSKKLSKKLQSSLSVTSVDPQQACKDLAERIVKFHEINLLPVPIDIDKLASDTAQKIKFSIKDFFSKCDQIFNGKLHFLWSVMQILATHYFSIQQNFTRYANSSLAMKNLKSKMKTWKIMSRDILQLLKHTT